ncbi:coiled-coil domain-containing protein 80-like isoform X2 [Carcharodon carcharias]|uniref:coiled-coil domain-containing protein 80-like isoform X2 n=1 Tax=Carcharodon carcharias TaxID=13397 RepID=UPI001B7F22E4|nr:coiled-coil domain-containing protein 80-like isoform X2 [Carcharodon carcharias]
MGGGGERRSARQVCLLLLSLLVAGSGGSPDLPGAGKDGPPADRAGSPALPAPRGGGGRSQKPPLAAPKAELGPLASSFGKFRLLVLAAPDPSDNSYRLMERQLDVKSRELRCQLALRDLLLLVLFQGAGGKLVTISQEGKVTEQKLEAEAVAPIMRHLSLKEGRFNMVLLRKSMQLYERFPYAVRMEAVLETVDQMPLRKIESVTRRGQQLRCKGSGARRWGPGQLHTNNRGMVNRGMVNRGMANRTLVNRVMANRTLVNRGMANRGMVNRTLVNRGMVNRGMVNRGMVNRTLANRVMVNRAMVNSRLRSASPNSQKPISPQSVGSLKRTASLHPGSSRRTLGKQKGSALTPNSVGKRTAESLRSAAKPRESPTIPVRSGQGSVETLMFQIKEKVQQMLMAKHRNPVQPRPALITQSGNQVSRTGPHTYHVPQVQSKDSASATSTMAPLNQPTAGTDQDFQLTKTTVLKWDQPQFSTDQKLDEGNPERPGIFESNPNTAQSQDRFPFFQTLENFSTAPTVLAHQNAESGHWVYGSPNTQATFPGLSNPSGRMSQVTHPHKDPLIKITLPKSPRAPVTAQPTEIWTRDKVGGAVTRAGTNLSPETEQRAGGTTQDSPTSVRPRGRKAESRHGGNSDKSVRNKGRKNRRNRKNKKNGSRNSKQIDNQELMGFLNHFRNKRRLLLLTAPSKDSKLYIHQRDEYLEHVCQLAVRRISMIAILGSQSNSTLTVEHYQNEDEVALENPVLNSVSVDLIVQLRRDFGMTFDEFFMVLVDYDMKVKQYFDVPIPVKVLVDYMDTLPSRRLEVQEEKENGVTCFKRRQFDINKFLSRLMWKRRLLIISSPSEEEWVFQQQLTSLHGQACNLGIRHFTLLKLIGSGEDTSGSLELFPLNGRSEVENEELSSMAVRGLREHFQISDEHFMMLLIGKDGTIKSWYLSPMWSLATIYELVDSMQLRQEEMKLQKTLGIYCHDDAPSPHYRGYPEHA